MSLTMLVPMTAPTDFRFEDRSPVEWSSNEFPFAPSLTAVTPLFVAIDDAWGAEFVAYMVSLGVREDDVFPQDEDPGCECEIDWRCPHHRGQATWLETRFDDRFEVEPWWATEREWAGAA
jgi:hypothetical protein